MFLRITASRAWRAAETLASSGPSLKNNNQKLAVALAVPEQFAIGPGAQRITHSNRHCDPRA
jgi:hypothetical protein